MNVEIFEGKILVGNTEETSIRVSLFDMNKSNQCRSKKYNQIHLGFIQDSKCPLFLGEKDISVLTSVMDNKLFVFEKALIGGIQSNLYNGLIWFTIKPNYFLALDDPNLNWVLGLKIQTQDTRDLDTKSKNIDINNKFMYRVI